MNRIDILKKFFDGGVPLLYGLGSLCSVLSLVGMLYKYAAQLYAGTREFNVSNMIIILVIMSFFSFVSWLLLTIGIREIKKPVKK